MSTRTPAPGIGKRLFTAIIFVVYATAGIRVFGAAGYNHFFAEYSYGKPDLWYQIPQYMDGVDWLLFVMMGMFGVFLLSVVIWVLAQPICWILYGSRSTVADEDGELESTDDRSDAEPAQGQDKTPPSATTTMR